MASADGSGAVVAGCGSGVAIGLSVFAAVSGFGCGNWTVSATATCTVSCASKAPKRIVGAGTSVLETRRGFVEQRVGAGDCHLWVDALGKDGAGQRHEFG